MSSHEQRTYTTAALLLTLAVAACDSPTAPPAPALPTTGVYEFDPPAEYPYWWSLVEQCAGRQAPLAMMTWYQDSTVITLDGVKYDGYWWHDGERILLAAGLQDYGPTVRHEMLHAILDRGDHPLEYFADRCAALVAFDVPETYGVNPSLAATAPLVSAESVLTVTIAPDSASPSRADNGGWFMYTVTATNTSGRPVWIDLSNDAEAWFAYDRPALLGGVRWDLKRLFFAAGQVRHQAFDAHVDSIGSLRVHGGFGSAVSPFIAVTTRP